MAKRKYEMSKDEAQRIVDDKIDGKTLWHIGAGYHERLENYAELGRLALDEARRVLAGGKKK